MTKASLKPPAFDPNHRLVVLHGEETLLLSEWTKRYEHMLDSHFEGVSRFDFDGETADLADVLDELRSVGMFSPHKLVVLDNADEFLVDSAGEKSKGKSRQRASLEDYAKDPVTDSSLLLRAKTWRASTLDKLIKKHGLVARCESPSAGDAAKWCVERTKSMHDRTINREAATMLVSRLGTSLGRLDSELGKLAALVEPGESITETDVVAMVGLSREEQGWVIQEAILAADPAVAVHKLRELMTVSKAPEPVLMWAIADLVRKLYDASRMIRQGKKDFEISKTLRLWGESKRAILQLARQHAPHEFAKLSREAIETDVRSKSGYARADRALEGLTLTVVNSLR